MSFCPQCGERQERQERQTPFCPGCGRKMAEGERPARSLPPIFWTFAAIIAAGVFVLVAYANETHRGVATVAGDIAAVRATPTAVAYYCSDAVAAVEAYHKVFWPVMAQFYPSLAVNCDPTMQQRSGETASQPVVVSWSTSARTYTAMYLVGPTGDVTPDDPVATQLDEFAKYSPLVLKAALAGL